MQSRILSRIARPALSLLLAFAPLLNGAPLSYALETPAIAEEHTYYFLTDHLGSTDVVLDDTGEIVQKVTNDAYGSEHASETAPNAPKTPQKFTGKELDEETGLYYYGARYYDPLSARFISADMWSGKYADPQTLNKYAYVLNNPLKYIDPLGLFNINTGEVEKGDNLTQITKKINTLFNTKYSVQELAKLNNIKNPNKIGVGQKITPNKDVPDITEPLTFEMKKWGKVFESMRDSGMAAKLTAFTLFSTEPDKADLKHRTGSIFDVRSKKEGGQGREGYVFNAEQIRYDAPGNMLYGFAARALNLSEKGAFFGAGANQSGLLNAVAGALSGEKTYTYGDDFTDNLYIRKGMNLYDNLKDNKTW